MKVGDYVRTKNKAPFEPSQIAKITDMKKDEGYKNQYFITLDHNLPTTYNFHIYSEDVIKPSPNILDLIEEDDLIEIGYEISTGEIQKEVLQVIKNNKGKLFVNTFIGKRFLEDFVRYDIGIFSIVTKEQFNFNKFDV